MLASYRIRVRSRGTRVALVGATALVGLLGVGPASGTSVQPPPGTRGSAHVHTSSTHQPAPGAHASTVSPGGFARTHQPTD